MFQFVHSTVSRQSQINHCILLSLTPKVLFESLIIHPKFAEIIFVEEKDSFFDIKSVQTIPIESPIRWIDICDNHIFSFTEKNQLLISNDLNFNPSSISTSIDLSQESIGFTENFQFFCFSKSKDFLLISSQSDHFFIVNISDISHIQMKPFFLNDGAKIIDATLSLDKNSFILKIEESSSIESEEKREEEIITENQNQNEFENHHSTQEDENDENDMERSESKDEEEDNESESKDNNNTENDNESENEENESVSDEEESEDEEKMRKGKKKKASKKSQNQKNKTKKSQIQKKPPNIKVERKLVPNQKFVFFDAASFSIQRTEPVYDDFISFIPTSDTTRSFTPSIKRNLIEINSKNLININYSIKIYSKFSCGIFACQLESNEIIITNCDSKTTYFISEAPQLENIFILQNSLILFATSTKNMFVEIPKIKRMPNKKGISAKSIQFKSLRIIKEIIINPLPTFSDKPSFFTESCSNDGSSLFFDHKTSKLLYSTDTGIYHLTSDVHVETGKFKCKTDDFTSIFAPVSDVVIGSNDEETHVVYGDAEISKKPTVAVLYFQSKHIQVHREGIHEFNGNQLYSCAPREITCAASNGIRLLIGHDDGKIILFCGSFSEFDEITVPEFTNLAICRTHLAIAEETKISLYNFALVKFSEFPIPSFPVSMVFLNYGRELYVSLHCGAVMKISENCATYPIFLNRDPQIIQTKESESSLYILDDFLYVYNHSRLIKTDLCGINAICTSYDEDEPLVLNLCFIHKKRLFIIQAGDLTYHYQPSKVSNFDFHNPKLFEFSGTLFALTDVIHADEAEEEKDRIEETRFSSIVEFESKEELLRIPEKINCFTKQEDYGYLFVSADKFIYCIGYKEKKLNVLYKVELSECPIALGSFYRFLAIGFANEIRIAEMSSDNLKFRDISLELASPLKTLFSNGFCWAVLNDSTIFTFNFNSSIDQFEIVSSGCFKPLNFTQFCIIDCRTVAAVVEDSVICFIRENERLVSKKTSFDIIGRFDAIQKVATLRRVGDAVIYVTEDGSVHALTCCNQDSRFRVMLSCQLKIRNQISKIFPFATQNDSAIANQYNVVDADVLDTFKNQNHVVKTDQEIMDNLMIIERQKLIFK